MPLLSSPPSRHVCMTSHHSQHALPSASCKVSPYSVSQHPLCVLLQNINAQQSSTRFLQHQASVAIPHLRQPAHAGEFVLTLKIRTSFTSQSAIRFTHVIITKQWSSTCHHQLLQAQIYDCSSTAVKVATIQMWSCFPTVCSGSCCNALHLRHTYSFSIDLHHVCSLSRMANSLHQDILLQAQFKQRTHRWFIQNPMLLQQF